MDWVYREGIIRVGRQDNVRFGGKSVKAGIPGEWPKKNLREWIADAGGG